MHSAITFNSRRHDLTSVERFETKEDVCLLVTSLNDNITWSIEVHRCMNLVGLK